MTELSREDFTTEIKTVVERQAQMDGGDMDMYFKLIQTVMSNGMGMDPIVIKKATKVPIKTPASEFKVLLKRLAKAGDEGDELVEDSKGSKYAAGMRINLQTVRTKFVKANQTALDEMVAYDEATFQADLANVDLGFEGLACISP